MADAKEALRGLVMLLIAGACGADSSYFAGARKCGAAFSVLSIGAPPMAGVSLRCPTFLIPKTSSPRHAKGRPQLWRARPRPAGTLALFATDVAEGDGWGWRADTVEYGDFVKVHYTGFLEDGTEFENTREKEPLEFLVGSGRVVPGVDSAVAGMVLGERRSAKVPCEEAFGYALKNRIVNVSIFEFPEEVRVGDRLGIKGLFAVVRSIDHEWVEIDANHPLAGEDLYLDVQVMELVKGSTFEEATFAGGSFWSLELTFQRIDGVISTQVGYTQGTKQNPTYAEICSGKTGHVEAVKVCFDPRKVTYLDLLEVYFATIDVTELNRQGLYEGPQYRSGLFYHSETQVLCLLALVVQKYKY